MESGWYESPSRPRHTKGGETEAQEGEASPRPCVTALLLAPDLQTLPHMLTVSWPGSPGGRGRDRWDFILLLRLGGRTSLGHVATFSCPPPLLPR